MLELCKNSLSKPHQPMSKLLMNAVGTHDTFLTS